MPTPAPTRGFGVLEGWLAKKRAKKAESLIPAQYRSGQVVDVCCGSPPLFLLRSSFSRKCGLDLRVESGVLAKEGIDLRRHDVSLDVPLPLADEMADAIVMLATVEHLAGEPLQRLFHEVYRILRPGGMLVLTTPAPIAGPILRLFATLKLVSAIEINDHKHLYSATELLSMLRACGFRHDDIMSGRFEFGLNTWVSARKPLGS
jgi:SAM-dependent methyltransferase